MDVLFSLTVSADTCYCKLLGLFRLGISVLDEEADDDANIIMAMMLVMMVIIKIIVIVIIMSMFLERLSMGNMLNYAEQVQIQKYKTHAYKTLKIVGVQTIMLKHPTKRKKE